MRHAPHLLVDGPWAGDEIGVTEAQADHLFKVLRASAGDDVTYTDGRGMRGSGSIGVGGGIVRGAEAMVARPSEMTVAAAPPSTKERQRFLVEKLAELGARELVWLKTRNGSQRVARQARLTSWARSGLEQSRGAWEMSVAEELRDWSDLVVPLVVCHPGGGNTVALPRTVAIGPEGGFEEDEIPAGSATWDLGPTILRVETAAIVAFSRLTAKN